MLYSDFVCQCIGKNHLERFQSLEKENSLICKGHTAAITHTWQRMAAPPRPATRAMIGRHTAARCIVQYQAVYVAF